MSLCKSEEEFTFSSAGVNSGTHPDLLLCLLQCQVLDTHQRPVCLHPEERKKQKTSKMTGLPPCTQIPTKDIRSDYKATGKRANKYETLQGPVWKVSITWTILRFGKCSVTLPPPTYIMTLLWGSRDGAVPLSARESAQGVWLIPNPPTWRPGLSLPIGMLAGDHFVLLQRSLKITVGQSGVNVTLNSSSQIYLILLLKIIMCDSEGRNIRETSGEILKALGYVLSSMTCLNYHSIFCTGKPVYIWWEQDALLNLHLKTEKDTDPVSAGIGP